MKKLSIDSSPNYHLIGVEGSRQQLNTPALLLDLDALERNIGKMAEHSRSIGTGLRPHSKSHKSANIAKKQIEAGAVGVCCANIGEAETMADAGISDILITSPVVTMEKIQRLCHLVDKQIRIKVVVDNSENVLQLNKVASSLSNPISVIVDIESGANRTGVLTVDDAVSLVHQVKNCTGLSYKGLQCYAGHVQHIADRQERRSGSLESLNVLQETKKTLAIEGVQSEVVTGGGTGTFDIDSKSGIFTDIQVGSYIFMDSQYAAVWSGELLPFETSLLVQMTVNSCNHSSFATVDAGLKHFAFDGGAPVLIFGVPDNSSYEYTGDEHGCIRLPPEAPALRIGDRIEGVVPHCDPTVNLYDYYHCVRNNTLVDIWPIDARGAF